ncbi:MAG TPA: hypothetical protein VNI82_00455 [Candidatus Nitrosotenuis sp.]|nr:hypothetical protein [Candidatus Nitrosotenuis sp.]
MYILGEKFLSEPEATSTMQTEQEKALCRIAQCIDTYENFEGLYEHQDGEVRSLFAQSADLCFGDDQVQDENKKRFVTGMILGWAAATMIYDNSPFIDS